MRTLACSETPCIFACDCCYAKWMQQEGRISISELTCPNDSGRRNGVFEARKSSTNLRLVMRGDFRSDMATEKPSLKISRLVFENQGTAKCLIWIAFRVLSLTMSSRTFLGPFFAGLSLRWRISPLARTAIGNEHEGNNLPSFY